MIRIILRADGNNKIGLGHVYRLLGLAEILQNDFECVFAIGDTEDFIIAEIKKSCSSFIQLSNAVEYKVPDAIQSHEEIVFDLEEHLCGNEIVVTDGYLFGKKYQLAIKSKGSKLICIDDLATTEFYADIVINHAPGVDPVLYKLQSNTQLLTGLDYAILRMPFFNPLPVRKKNPEGDIFISLGGSDFDAFTPKIVEVIAGCSQFKNLQVLYSSTFSSAVVNSLRHLQSKFPRIKLHANLNALQLVQLMDECRYAFVAASTVLLESYSRGLQCFAGYCTNNQKFIYDGFVKQNLVTGVGYFGDVNIKIMEDALAQKRKPDTLLQPLNSAQNLRRLFTSL